ncbi:MAG: hypothetical protein OEY11_14055 [Gammaproteobacteria bacterium]|nr:hypothetical protein [Gammaproteobacteria bacterium]
MNRRMCFFKGWVYVLAAIMLVVMAACSESDNEKQRIAAPEKLIKLPSVETGGDIEYLQKIYPQKQYQEFIDKFGYTPVKFPTKKSYSVYGNEFASYHQNIAWSSEGGLNNRYVSACDIAVCGLAAPIHIPDGEQIKGFSCQVLDNSATHPVTVRLFWTQGDIFTYSSTACTASTTTSGASAGIQTLSNTSCSLPVNNAKFAYGIQFHTVAPYQSLCENGGKECRIYQCKVNY